MSMELARLVVDSPRGSQRIYELTPGSIVIGRSAICDIVLRDAKASRKHARLDVSEDEIAITDLGSRGGVQVNSFTVDTATLAHQSKIAIAGYTLTLELLDPPSAAEPATEEYIEIEAGKNEPTVVESFAGADATQTHGALQQSLIDTTQPRLVVYANGAPYEITLDKDEWTIGRDADCDIQIDDPASSRHHARLRRVKDRYELIDLDSKNGTWLRGRRVTEHKLFAGTNFSIGDTMFVYKAAFRHEALTLDGTGSSGFESGERLPVVVLPGIMGSELVGSDGLFWPNVARALRNPERLAVGPDSDLKVGGIARQVVVVKGVIKLEAYSHLVQYLEEGLGYKSGHDLLQFAYDWRQDNRESAQKLKHAIDRWREEVIGRDTKFVILCHSMGALVSRYYLQCLGGASNVCKFVSMGGAHFGAPFMIQTLLSGPALLPLGFGRKGLHEALCTMPSGYQLVPPYPVAYDTDGNTIDIYEDDSWVKKEYRHLLKNARDFHRELGSTVSVPTTCIFGYGVKTVTRIEVRKRNEEGWQKVRFQIKPAGDNRVVDQYGFLQGADIHPVKQVHGALWTDNDVKMRLRIELLKNEV
ncbi:MAG: FHA domain-containing protein [Pseudomonadota bacterium]